jgi:hypothetical protein
MSDPAATLSDMSPVRRSSLPLTSAAELSFWWAEVLCEPDAADRALSLLWLHSAGHRLGRVLSISGVAAQPDRRVIGFVRQLRDVMLENSGEAAHLAIALTRSGRSSVTKTDHEWAALLRSTLDPDDEVTWSLHVATARWITTVIDPPTDKFDSRRIARRPPSALLDRNWLIDQN